MIEAESYLYTNGHVLLKKKPCSPPDIKFHHPSSNSFVYINGQKFPSLPHGLDKTRTCTFHKDLPEFITSQYTIFSYGYKEERCILCKNFKLSSDSRDVHVKSDWSPEKVRFSDAPSSHSPSTKPLPIKLHNTVNFEPATPRPSRDFYSSQSSKRQAGGLQAKSRQARCRTVSPTRGVATPSTRHVSPTRLVPSPVRRISPRLTLGKQTPDSVKHSSAYMRNYKSKLKAQQDEENCPSGCLNISFPPISKDSHNYVPRNFRQFTTPLDHYQPVVRIDHLFSQMKQALNPIYMT